MIGLSPQKNIGKINNFRIGESILLGLETIGRQAIPGLHTDIFQLVAEVIEFKNKPSLPFGSIGQDAFGNIPSFQNRGMRQRVIIALGRQDLLMSSMKVENGLEFLGSSSDHMILESNNKEFNVGDEVKFSLDYSGVLAAMTSPFIKKEYIKSRAYAAA
jgi:predicted amino acid racemase